MSPTEIPGDVLKFLTAVGKKKCANSHCNRDYNFAKLKQSDGVVSVHCPHCDHMVVQFNIKTLKMMAEKRGK
jgi:hypothetical protein